MTTDSKRKHDPETIKKRLEQLEKEKIEKFQDSQKRLQKI